MRVCPINNGLYKLQSHKNRLLNQPEQKNPAFQGKIFKDKRLRNIAIGALIMGIAATPGVGAGIAAGAYIVDKLTNKDKKDESKK